ncbi:MAG: gliding motility-associated C-terminal domain-containing protein [Bacteroidota bacterium]
MRKITLLFFVLALLSLNGLNAQTSIMVYSEDFENGAPGTMLNTTGNGSNSGDNLWVVNNIYTGMPQFPNTPDENQTQGGNISYAPYGYYLHIYDQTSGVNNCNYNQANASDRFVQFTSSFCTLGLTNVKFTFFYICEGSPTAYGQLYYSIANGPWIATGPQYGNQMIWKYETLQDPAFDNQTNIRFGIRWVNDAGAGPGLMSFGMDDVFITGDFDNFSTNFDVIVDSVSPNPICQNFGLMIYYHLTVPICGNGFFEVQLSDMNGSFANPTSLGIYQASNQWMNGVLWPTIPSTTAAGTCYKIRIKYYYIDYGLNFFSDPSPCFEVLQCPNTINTLQPVVTMGGDSVCVGSVIDVPFYSTGVFQAANVYIAELSDSAGNFPPNPNVLGSNPDNNSYDPAQGSPPGSVSGQVNENNQPIQDGCHYYIRVRSTAPATIGMVWGPFCIRHCDIETNYKQDIQACISSTQGFDTTVRVNIHFYDSTAIYGQPNQFLIEVRESQYFTVVNTGGLGTVTANSDTTMTIHIPPVPGLGALGLQPGMFYLRIIATNSNHTWDMLGTLVHLTIGAPSDNLWIFQTPGDSILCVGDAVYFYPIPYNAGPPMNSTYEWYLNGVLFSTNPALGILFNGQGNFNLTVQETNYGCKGPVTPNDVSLQVLGPPSAAIIGPNQVCLGDTLYYHTVFHPNIYYEWTTSGGDIIDTSNNELYIRFDTAGVYTIHMMALNKCGQTLGNKSVIVTAHPDAGFSAVSPVCTGENSMLNYTGTTAPPLSYSWYFAGGIGVPGGNSPGPQYVSWNTAGPHYVILTVTKYSCATKDTMLIDVLQGPTAGFTYENTCSGIPTIFSDSSQGNPASWNWDFGDFSSSTETNPVHTFAIGGTYIIGLIESAANGCSDTLTENLTIFDSPKSAFETKSPLCLGENTTVMQACQNPPNAVFDWTFSDGIIISGSGTGPYEIAWPGLGEYPISLTVSANGCISETTTVVVKVNDCILEIPNIFTPNTDGSNDKFVIKGLESFPDSKLQIFNRWGKMIFSSDDYKNDWTGDDHSDGVYYYVLALKDGREFNGTLTLLR